MIEQLSKNEIRGIFMRNGFTVKEGCDDLKDYVYAAAYDLLKAQEERHRTIEARLSSIEKMLSAESKPQEPEWRPMSEAPKGLEEPINVKHAKTGEEYFAFFFVDGWSCSRSQHPAANTFLFFDSQLSGWRPL